MFVTTFSEDGYHKYGKRLLETFLTHTTEKIVVYVEDDYVNLDELDEVLSSDLDRVMVLNFWEIEGAADLVAGLARTPTFKGVIQTREGAMYSFRHDAHKFCRKVLAIADWSRYADENFAWIDGDCYFHSDLPEGFIDSLVPGDTFAAALQRPDLYTECGFMAFNISHPLHRLFMQLYQDQYFTGAFSYLAEYHDSFIFDFVAVMLRCPINNLTPEGAGIEHPFVMSVLAQYMDHLKGPRKDMIQSPEHTVLTGEQHATAGG